MRKLVTQTHLSFFVIHMKHETIQPTKHCKHGTASETSHHQFLMYFTYLPNPFSLKKLPSLCECFVI